MRELKQDLQVHRQCQELSLALLTEDEVAQYVGRRFPVETASQMPFDELVRYVYRHPEGNPLYMVNVIDELRRFQGCAPEGLAIKYRLKYSCMSAFGREAPATGGP